MTKPTRTADLGTVASVADDLRLLRSKGGIAAAKLPDLAGTLSLTESQASGTDQRLQYAQDLLRTATTAVCSRIHNQSAGHGLEVGAISLERILLPEIPVRNQVVAIRTAIAGVHLRSPEYVSEYEDQVIELIAREVFSTLRRSDATRPSDAHLPRRMEVAYTGAMPRVPVVIREAIPDDHDFVVNLMDQSLSPYYGGDHRAHAERIFSTHIAGGIDDIGHFSVEQRMFLALVGDTPAGMVHLVGKRQRNYKISPLIVVPEFRGKAGVGRLLLEYAELYASAHAARQIYCTVADANVDALGFFQAHGYIVVGQSESHYKPGITEKMLFKPLQESSEEAPDRPNISVIPCEELHESQVRRLLLDFLCVDFFGIDDSWVDALFAGYRRRASSDVNRKFKLLFVAVDRDEKVLGVVGATPKKGQPIKLMPFCAVNEPAFLAFLADLPFQLKQYGRKIYAHLSPSPTMVQALQQHGWHLDAAMPRAYHEDRITYQWSLDVSDNKIRTVRVKDQLLDYIKQGRKTLEVRVGYDNISKIQSGDIVNFTSHAHEQVVRILDVRRYVTFQEMLRHEDADRIMPGYTSSQALELLKNIYPPRREQLGVVVLEIERVDGFARHLKEPGQ